MFRGGSADGFKQVEIEMQYSRRKMDARQRPTSSEIEWLSSKG